MDQIVGMENIDELIKAQTQIWNTSLSFIKSMCLKCAIELSIPDIINNHGQPISLSDLTTSLPIHPSKTQHIFRLMRILVHSGFFSTIKNGKEITYSPTPSSRLLMKNTSLDYTPFVSFALDPILVHPFEHLTTWLKNDDINPLFTTSNDTIWEIASNDRKFGNMLNDCMASDSGLVSKMVLVKYKEVFKGVESLVDVGGGNGKMARAIAEAFPSINCTVLDQLHVVADFKGENNLNFVDGDFFHAIPPADAVLLKSILHDWTDEECVKILKNCKEAIMKRKDKEGKIIIIEVVIGNQTCEDDWTEAQLLFDMEMMSCCVGKERTEKEWAKLFLDSGFSNYKLYPILGPRALIELYP